MMHFSFVVPSFAPLGELKIRSPCSTKSTYVIKLTNVRASADGTGTVYVHEVKQMCKSLQGIGLEQ